MANTRKPVRHARVHDGLVGAQTLLGTDYLADPELRAQYEREIAPRTRAQLGKILGQLPPDLTVARALDLGAGTGAAGAALRARFGDQLDLVSVDKVGGPGILRADLRRGLPATIPAAGAGFDLIVAAHLLSELRDLDLSTRAQLVDTWSARLAPGGRCVLIEPALREASRGLLAVRDRLVASARWFVEAPCFMQGPCPALLRERDFCHDSAPWTPDQSGPGRGASPRADFSYLVLRRTVPGAPPREARTARFRVVSDLLHEKGRLRLWGCGAAGRHALVLQNRDLTQENQAFSRLLRGQAVELGGLTPAGDGLHLAPGSPVTVVPGGTT